MAKRDKAESIRGVLNQTLRVLTGKDWDVCEPGHSITSLDFASGTATLPKTNAETAEAMSIYMDVAAFLTTKCGILPKTAGERLSYVETALVATNTVLNAHRGLPSSPYSTRRAGISAPLGMDDQIVTDVARLGKRSIDTEALAEDIVRAVLLNSIDPRLRTRLANSRAVRARNSRLARNLAEKIYKALGTGNFPSHDQQMMQTSLFSTMIDVALFAASGAKLPSQRLTGAELQKAVEERAERFAEALHYIKEVLDKAAAGPPPPPPQPKPVLPPPSKYDDGDDDDKTHWPPPSHEMALSILQSAPKQDKDHQSKAVTWAFTMMQQSAADVLPTRLEGTSRYTSGVYYSFFPIKRFELPLSERGRAQLPGKSYGPCEVGIWPRFIERHALGDGAVFQGRARGNLGRPSFLFDISGSMGHVPLDDIIATLGQANVALYTGIDSYTEFANGVTDILTRNKNYGLSLPSLLRDAADRLPKGGGLWIVARGGRYANRKEIQAAFRKGGGDGKSANNACDLPALHWLANQPRPRFWITDGNANGLRIYKNICHTDENGYHHMATRTFAQQNNIHRYECWEELKPILRAAVRRAR